MHFKVIWPRMFHGGVDMVIESSTTLEHNRQKTKLHSSSQILSLQLVSSLLVSHPRVCHDLLLEHFRHQTFRNIWLRKNFLHLHALGYLLKRQTFRNVRCSLCESGLLSRKHMSNWPKCTCANSRTNRISISVFENWWYLLSGESIREANSLMPAGPTTNPTRFAI